MSGNVFTYWEGEPYAFTQLCIDSISRVFGASHVHLGPESLAQWISLPEDVRNCKHISFRSDMIRTLLLQQHGGWWFDCDVLLLRDPSDLVSHGEPMIWNLIYKVQEEWVPLINNGILYSPPRSEWIERIASDFAAVDRECLRELTWENEDIGQSIYERHSVNATTPVKIGHEHNFNSTVNVDADFAPFWDGRITLSSAQYGIHIGASLSRWAARAGNDIAKRTLSIKSVDELIEAFPRSLVADYVNIHGQR